MTTEFKIIPANVKKTFKTHKSTALNLKIVDNVVEALFIL